MGAAAAAFEQFLRLQGQAWIHWRLEQMRRTTGTGAQPATAQRVEKARSAAGRTRCKGQWL